MMIYDIDSALNEVDLQLKRGKNDLILLLLKSYILEAMELNAKSLNVIKKAINLHPNFYGCYEQAGDISEKMKRYKSAIKYYRKSQEILLNKMKSIKNKNDLELIKYFIYNINDSIKKIEKKFRVKENDEYNYIEKLSNKFKRE